MTNTTPNDSVNIIIVDDDVDLSKIISTTLEKENYKVKLYNHGRDFVTDYKKSEAFRNQCDVILLDIAMPEINGEQILTMINEINTKNGINTSPIIIMFTNDGNWTSNVKYKEIGADDYVDKSQPTQVLVSTINARIRERQKYSIVKTIEPEPIITNNDKVTFNERDRIVTISNNDVSLTKTEYLVFRILYQNEGHIIDPDEFKSAIYETLTSLILTSRTIDVHISNLRRKIAKVDNDFASRIKNRKGLGYILEQND